MNIGRISRIARYPFKSMAPERLDAGYIMYSGIQGDRVFALVNPKARQSFPWLSIRENPELARYVPRYINLPDPSLPYPAIQDYEIEIRTPEGTIINTSELDFDARLGEYLGRACQVRFSERSMVDARPLSLLSEQTIQHAEGEIGRPLGWKRFRANLYIDWTDLPGFGEAAFVGKSLRIGDKAEVQLSKTDPRCAIITVDPDTGDRNPEILKHIVQKHDNVMGVYAIVLREGPVRVGDQITIIS